MVCFILSSPADSALGYEQVKLQAKILQSSEVS